MPASNPGGGMQFWDAGFPFCGVKLGSNDAGQMQFWNDGFPMQYQFPPAAGGSLIKTKKGLAIASVKTFKGLAIASTKSDKGLTNV